VTGLLNDLVTLTALRLSNFSAGPDAMRIGVVFTGTNAARVLSKGVGRLPLAGVDHRREADENPASGWSGVM
jgi:hypothetical protein